MKKKLFALFTILVVGFMPMAALALDIPDTTPPPGCRNFQCYLNIMDTVINWLFTILMVVGIIMIIYAAFLYLTAGGDEEKVGAAHKYIINAVIAFVVAMLAKGVPFVVSELLGQG